MQSITLGRSNSACSVHFKDPIGLSSHSVASGSAPTSQVGMQHALERRVEWLEEDLGVTQRRLRDTFGLAPGGGKDGGTGMASLQALAQSLEAELKGERQWRTGLEAQMDEIEDTLRSERASRGHALKNLSVELDGTIKGIIKRIDIGLGEETRRLSGRTKKAEEALRDLITRVETGLSTNCKPLQDVASPANTSAPPDGNPNSPVPKPLSYLVPVQTAQYDGSTTVQLGQMRSLPGAMAVSQAVESADAAAAEAVGGYATSSRDPVPASIAAIGTLAIFAPTEANKLVQATEPLLKVWGELQQENQKLQQRRNLLSNKHQALSGAASRDERVQEERTERPRELSPSTRHELDRTRATLDNTTGSVRTIWGNTHCLSAKPLQQESPMVKFRQTTSDALATHYGHPSGYPQQDVMIPAPPAASVSGPSHVALRSRSPPHTQLTSPLPSGQPDHQTTVPMVKVAHRIWDGPQSTENPPPLRSISTSRPAAPRNSAPSTTVPNRQIPISGPPATTPLPVWRATAQRLESMPAPARSQVPIRPVPRSHPRLKGGGGSLQGSSAYRR